MKNWLNKLKNWWKKIEQKWKEYKNGADKDPSGATGNDGTDQPGTGVQTDGTSGDQGTTGDGQSSTTIEGESGDIGDTGSSTVDSDLDEYKNLDCGLFWAEGMFPKYEQVAACTCILPTCVDRNTMALSWDASAIEVNVRPNEELKIVQVWFRKGQAILFKDWGVDCPPYGDCRWYKNDDLRRSELEYDARLDGNKMLVMLVTTFQPVGMNDISRVIARSKVFTW